MKVLAAILAVLVLALSSCGGDDAATGSEEKDSASATASDSNSKPSKGRIMIPSGQDDPHFPVVTYDGKGRRAEPAIEPPGPPPPEQLLVRDVDVGTGPVARSRDDVVIWYIDFFYKNGKQAFYGWAPPASPYTVHRLGTGRTFAAMEEGIEGMRVGGRREMVVPGDRAFGDGESLYVLVDLVAVEPAKAPRGG